MTATCEYCGHVFDIAPFRYRRATRHFCTREHMSAAKAARRWLPNPAGVGLAGVSHVEERPDLTAHERERVAAAYHLTWAQYADIKRRGLTVAEFMGRVEDVSERVGGMKRPGRRMIA